jgi:tRNA threonylcarbamoyladenosine biosynthesis protein TsaB
MRILALETSIGECTVALRDGYKVFLSTSPRKMSQSEELVPRINQLLEAASLSYQNLDAVACSIGPGSFTGIRVGIATARGIKKAMPSLKTIGVSTLQLIATYSNNNSSSLISLQSYGSTFYTQEFDSLNNPKSDIIVMTAQDILDNSHQKIVINIDQASQYINAYNVLQTATKIAVHRNDALNPLYAQQPNIYLKKNI